MTARLVMAFSLCAVALGAQVAPRAGSPEAAAQEQRRIAAGIQLRSDEIRALGVPASDLQTFVDAMTQSALQPRQQLYYLTTERDAARLNGPTDNFGSFVQRRLAAGDRGRVLAAAIRNEHRLHGKKPKKAKKMHPEHRDGENNDQGEHHPAGDPHPRGERHN